MNRIASQRYIDGSRGQPCALRCSEQCDGGGETSVFAHIRDRHTGLSIKASDISGADACFHCHELFDGRAGSPLPSEVWLFHALRGLQETLENRIARGLLFLTQDVHREPKPVTRKPKAERKPVGKSRPRSQRKAVWPSSKIETANNLKRRSADT